MKTPEDSNYPGLEKAERHARFYADRTRKVTYETFIDAFTHGYKHGYEDGLEEGKKCRESGKTK